MIILVASSPAFSDRPGNLRRSSTTAASSPSRSKAARIASVSASVMANMDLRMGAMPPAQQAGTDIGPPPAGLGGQAVRFCAGRPPGPARGGPLPGKHTILGNQRLFALHLTGSELVAMAGWGQAWRNSP